MIEDVLKAIGLIVVGGGALVTFAYGLFKMFAQKWLDAKFQERLAAYKHEQEKELVQLRFRISSLLDRATKLHQREFEVLPDAWARLNDAYWKGLAFVSPAQQYPDLNKMSDQELEGVLSNCPLDAWEKNELKSQRDRTAYYIEHYFWHRLADTKTAARESHVYLLKNGIFLPAEIRAKFSELDDLIWAAIGEREFSERYKDIPREMEKGEALRKKGTELLKDLEAEVQGRLWNSQDSKL